jgi:hypothetical protein
MRGAATTARWSLAELVQARQQAFGSQAAGVLLIEVGAQWVAAAS